MVDATRERSVVRWPKCPFMERYKELKVDPEFRGCYDSCPKWGEEGLKAVNPKLTVKSMKRLPRGEPYCEWIIGFKEE